MVCLTALAHSNWKGADTEPELVIRLGGSEGDSPTAKAGVQLGCTTVLQVNVKGNAVVHSCSEDWRVVGRMRQKEAGIQTGRQLPQDAKGGNIGKSRQT